MARENGLHRRQDSRFWWFDVVLPDGRRIRQSAGTESRAEAEAFLARLKADAYRDSHLGIKQKRSWQEAVVRYLSIKATIRSAENYRGICRRLHAYLGQLTLDQINADVILNLCERERKKGRQPATINRYLGQIRAVLRMAYYDWQWIDRIPRVRMLHGEVERNRWLTKDEAKRLIAACPPHLVPMVRYALATGCRAREVAELEWDRVDLERGTAWLDQTKNGTPRGVPLNSDAIAALESVRGQHPRYCFTYRGKFIRWELTNTGWKRAVAKAGLGDLRFHDLRHTWASWHRQAGTSTDELKDLGGWKSRSMVDRYAKFGTEHLTRAAARIESGKVENVDNFPRFPHVQGRPALRIVR